MKFARTVNFIALTLLSLLIVFWLGPAGAQPSALGTVQEATQVLLDTLRKEEDALRGNPARIHALVNEILSPYVDFPRMARLVLGKHWRVASAQQRNSFTREFRTLLVRFYSAALADFLVDERIPDDLTVTFLPLQENAAGDRVTVKTKVSSSSYPEVAVNYDLYRTDGAWKMYDVTVDGISLVLNYRSSFSSQIREKGIEGLIRELAERNARV